MNSSSQNASVTTYVQALLPVWALTSVCWLCAGTADAEVIESGDVIFACSRRGMAPLWGHVHQHRKLLGKVKK